MKMPPLVAHLDLKGVLYHPEYYSEYFGNLRALGYDALLVEYEDLFPFESAPVSIRPETVWSAASHRRFLQAAAEANVEIIPLQQCLGHLEYAFRVPGNCRYSIPGGDLRDLDATCPEARQWLKTLLEEVLRAHPSSRYIHLGMDEAGGFVKYAKGLGREPLGLFLDYLEELCEVCERHGKTPLIWSDMLEDHLCAGSLDRLLGFRGRVILVPWNYGAGVRPQSVVRFAGMRCSRQWLENPQGGPECATPIGENLLYFEDWEPAIEALAKEFRISPWLMEPLFAAAVWKRLGFTVWGGAGGSVTQDRALLPYYNWRMANIREWKKAGGRYRLDGLIITQWLRSNGFTVPNVIPDAVWPILAQAASREESASAFFPGVKGVDDLFFKIGKCREAWCIEESLVEAMERAEPSLHRYEWKTIGLLLRLHRVHKGIAHREEQVGCYAGIGRLNERGWETDREHLCELKRELLELRPKLRGHLEQRYGGEALEEWFYKAFSQPAETLGRLEESVQKSVALERQRAEGVKFRAV